MEDSSFTTILETYLKSINLHATYQLIPDKGSKHDRSVCFEVSVADKTVLGIGKSKKEAKENAAEIMYKNLIQEEKEKKKKKSQEDSKNPIEDLTNLCSKLNLGTPKFEFKSGKAASHGTMYSVSCSVSTLKEEVKSFRKDRAKKQVANNMIMKLKDYETVHDQYFSLAEEAKKDASHLTPDGEIKQQERLNLITVVWKEQFGKFVQKSETALDLKKKCVHELEEIVDLEGIFKRIFSEMDVPYNLSFNYANGEWVCLVEIFPIHFKISTTDKNKQMAGKKTIKKVLECIHSL